MKWSYVITSSLKEMQGSILTIIIISRVENFILIIPCFEMIQIRKVFMLPHFYKFGNVYLSTTAALKGFKFFISLALPLLS